jgi:hypothetical protein
MAVYLRGFGKLLNQSEFSEEVVKTGLSAGRGEGKSRRGAWVAVRRVVRAVVAVEVPDLLLER